jgi:hypothetical protein
MSAVVKVKPISARRVYVVCPGDLVTGGPELLHQLVDALRKEGREAFIVYHPFRPGWRTAEPYRRYDCEIATNVPDEEDCAVVVPEVHTPVLNDFRRTQHVIWWLSVDYYLGTASLQGWQTRMRRWFTADIPSPATTVHLFQSHYARDFVRRRFGAQGFMLSDYIAPDYFAQGTGQPRRNAVAFNPKKGYAFTRRFMRRCGDIEFVPLQGMTRLGMRDALDACTVYIDFGPHPGKDRIPREAALRGAVVIVGRYGSANHEDIPIDDRYKIAVEDHALDRLGQEVRAVFADYPHHHAAQEPYRQAIAAEPGAFRRDVRRAFGWD